MKKLTFLIAITSLSFGVVKASEFQVVYSTGTSCTGYTYITYFNLSKPTYIKDIKILYKWSSNEKQVAFTLYYNKSVFLKGKFVKETNCNQQICEGFAPIYQTLPSGEYLLRIVIPRQCRDPTGNGVLKIIGKIIENRPKENSNISKNFKYVGCFKDSGDPFGTKGRDLNGLLKIIPLMSIEKCIKICRNAGFKFAGLQEGNKCFCGNNYGKYGRATNCIIKCRGNPHEICGGFWSNSVYKIINYKGTILEKLFKNPKVKGYALDWCKYPGKNCGKEAADAFCIMMGYSYASDWKKEPKTGAKNPTYIIGTGEICKFQWCDSFKYIRCTK